MGLRSWEFEFPDRTDFDGGMHLGRRREVQPRLAAAAPAYQREGPGDDEGREGSFCGAVLAGLVSGGWVRTSPTKRTPLRAIVRISPNRHRTVIGLGQLMWPSGLATRGRSVFVSNCSIAPASGFGPCPNGGQVVRFRS